MVRELLKCPDIDPHIGVSRDEKESEIIILIQMVSKGWINVPYVWIGSKYGRNELCHGGSWVW